MITLKGKTSSIYFVSITFIRCTFLKNTIMVFVFFLSPKFGLTQKLEGGGGGLRDFLMRKNICK